MKILIFANNDVGLYKFRKELIESLLQNNQVFISLPDGGFVKPLIDLGCSFVNTKIDRRGINPFKDLLLLRSYRKIVKRIAPDLIITYTIKPNIYGGFIAKKKRIKYCSNITGLGSTFQHKGLLNRFVIFLYKVALKNAKTVFFENSANRDIFIQNGIVNVSQAHLLNGAGVNINEYVPLEYPPLSKGVRFLFIGRVMKEKGIEELIYAMRKLVIDGNNTYLDIVGSYEENYKSLIEDCEKEGWLNYHGFQPDVRPFIEKCHCFVLPSWHEGMANTNLECAASARPVITSNIPGCRESIIDGVSGFLCEPKNPNNLYETMKKFVDYREKKQMGDCGRQHMVSSFDKKIIVRDTIEYLLDDYDK